jgi:hypothetical protein
MNTLYINLSVSMLWRYILVSLSGNIPALLNFHFLHWIRVTILPLMEKKNAGLDEILQLLEHYFAS